MTFRNSIVFIFLVGLAALFQSCARKDPTNHNSTGNLKKTALKALEENRFEDAAHPLEKLVARHPDDPAIAKIKLGLANCYFRDEQYESAFQLYEHFCQAYPADRFADFAKYRAALSKYNQTLSADRDQVATTETIKACKAYQENLSFQQYRKEVMSLHKTCTQKILDREIYVFNFYLERNRIDAAKTRLASIKQQFGAQQDELLPRILYLEAQLAHKGKDSDLLKKNLDTLNSKFEQSPYTKLARALDGKHGLLSA